MHLTKDELDRLTKMMADRAKKEAQARTDFAASETFKRMLKAFDKREEVQTDSENLAYFFEKECRKLGWDGITEADVRLFLDVLCETQGPGVEPGSYKDTSKVFPSFHFKSYGVWVSVMIGQGSIVYVGNQRAFDSWNEE